MTDELKRYVWNIGEIQITSEEQEGQAHREMQPSVETQPTGIFAQQVIQIIRRAATDGVHAAVQGSMMAGRH